MHKIDIMFELSHPARIGILRLAAAKGVRHRDLMAASGLPPSEVTRHAGRLLKGGFLKKNRNGEMTITRVGKYYLEWLDNSEFISFNSPFFEKHTLDSMPVGFDSVSMLRKCVMLDETMDIVNSAIQISAESKSFTNCILDRHSDALVGVHVEKIRSGNEINIISSAGRPVPLEYSECRAHDISIKALKQVPFFMILTETRAMLCFRTTGGGIDYSTGFVSGDTDFLEWCEALFNHYWQRGRTVVL